MNLGKLIGIPLGTAFVFFGTLALVFSATVYQSNQQMDTDTSYLTGIKLEVESSNIFINNVMLIMYSSGYELMTDEIDYFENYFILTQGMELMHTYNVEDIINHEENIVNIYKKLTTKGFYSFNIFVYYESFNGFSIGYIYENEWGTRDIIFEKDYMGIIFGVEANTNLKITLINPFFVEEPGADNGDAEEPNIEYEERITLDFNLRFNFITTENVIYRFENISAEETITMIVNDQEHVFLLEMIVNRNSLLHSLRDYLTTGDEVVFKIADKVIYGTVDIGSMTQFYFTDIETHIELVEIPDDTDNEIPGTDEDQDNDNDEDQDNDNDEDQDNDNDEDYESTHETTHLSWWEQFVNFLTELFFVQNTKKE